MKRKFLFCFAVLFFAAHVAAQIQFPENDYFTGWKKSDNLLKFQGSALFNHINGGAELFHEFGFDELLIQSYQKGTEEISLEIYRMESPASALGIYLMKCGNETSVPGISARNSGSRFQLTIVKSNYFIQINNFTGKKNLLPDMVKFAQFILKPIPDDEPLKLFDYLPADNLIAGTEKLFRGKYALEPIYTFGGGDILQLKGKIFGITADYQFDQKTTYTCLIIPYPSEKYAQEVFNKLKEDLDPYLKIVSHINNGFVFKDYEHKYGLVKIDKNLVTIKIHLPVKPGDPEAAISRAVWTISAAECLDHVKQLASKKFSGRGTGSAGFHGAAQYIAHQFKEMGLAPAVGDSSYFQIFAVGRNVINEDSKFAVEVIIPSDKSADTLWVDYDLGKEFLPSGFSSKIDDTVKVVFVGYGMSSPENEWDDYASTNVSGKAVIVLRGAPPIKNAKWGTSTRMRNKVTTAQSHGAAAFITVGAPIGIAADCQKIPSLIVSEKVANDLLKGTGHTIKSLQEFIKKTGNSVSLAVKNRIRLRIDARLHSNCKTMNIIGYLAGSDPALKSEFVVVGAHADHLGGMGKMIFRGANDNASGTATVMEIAEAFTTLEKPPKRSIIFMAFTGEEMGLIGSKYYTDHPLFPLKKTKAMINLDMVGSGRNGVMIVGGHSFPDFAEYFDRYHSHVAYGSIKRRWISNNSDHYSFYEKGIPAVFLYAMGGLPTYHSVRDKPKTLDAEVMESIGRLVFRVIYDLANRETIDLPRMEQN